VALLHEGRVLAEDTPDALRAKLTGALFEVIVSDHRQARDRIAQLPFVSSVQMFGERAHVRLAGSASESAGDLRHHLGEAGLEVESVRPIATSLEDVFIARLGGEQS
jgi:ABC-type multidrug transport system ATPase subunit